MGNKSKSKESKKAGTSKKAEKDKSEHPKSTKKAAQAEAKEPKAQHSKKRPAPESEAVPAAPYQPETSELEKKRLQVADELRKVEQQIYDLESKYLDQASAFGNAVRGYQGFLGGLSQANRKLVIKPEERLFSTSSSSSIPPR